MRLTLAILVVAVTVGVNALPTPASSPLAISASKLMVRSPDDTALSMRQSEKLASTSTDEKASSLDFKQTGPTQNNLASTAADTSVSALGSQKLDGSSVNQFAGQTAKKVDSAFDQGSKMGTDFAQKPSLAGEGVDKIRNQVGAELGKTQIGGSNTDAQIGKGQVGAEVSKTGDGLDKTIAQVGNGQVGAEVSKTGDEVSKTIAQVGQAGQLGKEGSKFGIQDGKQLTGTASSGFENKKFQSNTQSQSAMQSGSSSRFLGLQKTNAFFGKQKIEAFESRSSSFEYRSTQTIKRDFSGFTNGFVDFRNTFQTSAWSQTQTVEYYKETCSNFNFLSQKFVAYDFSQGVDASFSQGFVTTLFQYLQTTQQILTLLIQRFGTLEIFSAVFAENYAAVQRCMAVAIRLHIDLSWIFSRLDMRIFAQAGLSFDRFQAADVGILTQGGYKYSMVQSQSTSSSMATGGVLR